MDVQWESGEASPGEPPPPGRINKAVFKLFGRRKPGSSVPAIFSVRSKAEGTKAAAKAALVRSRTLDGLAEAGSPKEGAEADGAGLEEATEAPGEDMPPQPAPPRPSISSIASVKSLNFLTLLRGGSRRGGSGRQRGGLRSLLGSVRWPRRARDPEPTSPSPPEGLLLASRSNSVEIVKEHMTLTPRPPPRTLDTDNATTSEDRGTDGSGQAGMRPLSYANSPGSPPAVPCMDLLSSVLADISSLGSFDSSGVCVTTGISGGKQDGGPATVTDQDGASLHQGPQLEGGASIKPASALASVPTIAPTSATMASTSTAVSAPPPKPIPASAPIFTPAFKSTFTHTPPSTPTPKPFPPSTETITFTSSPKSTPTPTIISAPVTKTTPFSITTSSPPTKPTPVPITTSPPAPKPTPALTTTSVLASKPTPAPTTTSTPAPKPTPSLTTTSPPPPTPTPSLTTTSPPPPKPTSSLTTSPPAHKPSLTLTTTSPPATTPILSSSITSPANLKPIPTDPTSFPTHKPTSALSHTSDPAPILDPTPVIIPASVPKLTPASTSSITSLPCPTLPVMPTAAPKSDLSLSPTLSPAAAPKPGTAPILPGSSPPDLKPTPTTSTPDPPAVPASIQTTILGFVDAPKTGDKTQLHLEEDDGQASLHMLDPHKDRASPIPPQTLLPETGTAAHLDKRPPPLSKIPVSGSGRAGKHSQDIVSEESQSDLGSPVSTSTITPAGTPGLEEDYAGLVALQDGLDPTERQDKRGAKAASRGTKIPVKQALQSRSDRQGTPTQSCPPLAKTEGSRTRIPVSKVPVRRTGSKSLPGTRQPSQELPRK